MEHNNCCMWFSDFIFKTFLVTHITKSWREIVDPAGATISQVQR